MWSLRSRCTPSEPPPARRAETVLGPLGVFLAFGEVPSRWTLAGGALLLGALAAHELAAPVDEAAAAATAAPAAGEKTALGGDEDAMEEAKDAEAVLATDAVAPGAGAAVGVGGAALFEEEGDDEGGDDCGGGTGLLGCGVCFPQEVAM